MADINVPSIAAVRELRDKRQKGVLDFIDTLGFKPSEIRRIEIRNDRIVVFKFTNEPPVDGQRSLVEIELLFMQTPDLDDAQTFEEFIDGKPVE